MTKLAFSGVSGKEAAVRDWVRRKLGTIDHELRVARAARQLFRLTSHWHKLEPAHGRLLVLGALTHDVGRAIEEKKHAQRGARMITEARTLSLSDSDRRALAFLARYHKGPAPEPRTDEYLDRDIDDVSSLHILLGLLRASDALDSRNMEPPRLYFVTRGRTLRIDGYVTCHPTLAAETFGREKKFRLLEQLLDCEVRTTWHSAKHLRLAI